MWNNSQAGFPDLLEIEEASVSFDCIADNGWFIASADATQLTPFAAQFLHDHDQGVRNGLVVELLKEEGARSKGPGKKEL